MRQEGFTLLEVLLTVGIILLVASSAALSYPRLIASYRMKEATITTATAVREAQVRAVKEGRPWRLLVDADGRGVSLQSAADPTVDPAQCGLSGWETDRHESFDPSIVVETATMSLQCVTFAQSGRGAWTTPQVIPTLTTQPSYGGLQGWLRMFDGITVIPPQPPASFSPLSSTSNLVVWWGMNPILVFDVGGTRRFGTITIGMYANPTSYRYPSTIKVEATAVVEGTPQAPAPPADPALWTVLYNGPGPTNPPTGTRAMTAFPVSINGSYRFIRITLTRNGSYVVLDEIEMSNLYLRLNGHGMARQLVISPVTGRVSVENINL